MQGGSSGKLIGKWQGKLKDEVDEANAILMDRKQIKKIWREVDFNGNGYVSLAEIDKVERITVFFRVHNPSFNHFLLRPCRWLRNTLPLVAYSRTLITNLHCWYVASTKDRI